MKLLVLLSAYNGERYLRAQLESLLAQTLEGVEILVRDDGSTDGTKAILEEYASRGALRWFGGENLGCARSFWALLHESEDADYYAFCDQDDVWDADKLMIAVRAIEGERGPALYCSDVRVTDEKLRLISDHMQPPTVPGLRHALIKNIAPGCTFVFNRAAKELLCRCDAEALGIEIHDWTAYQIVAARGRVVFDAEGHMAYRQHGGNAIGAVADPGRAFLEKIGKFWNGERTNSRSRMAQRLERVYGADLNPEDAALTACLAHYREDATLKRKLLAYRLGTGKAEQALVALLILFDKL